MIAGPKTLAGLKAPPDTEPPIKHKKPNVKPIAIGAKPAFVLPDVVYYSFSIFFIKMSFL